MSKRPWKWNRNEKSIENHVRLNFKQSLCKPPQNEWKHTDLKWAHGRVVCHVAYLTLFHLQYSVFKYLHCPSGSFQRLHRGLASHYLKVSPYSLLRCLTPPCSLQNKIKFSVWNPQPFWFYISIISANSLLNSKTLWSWFNL